MRDRCSCCWKIRTVTPMFIKRKYSKNMIQSGQICKPCWEGHGPSYPTVYFP